MPPQKRRRIDEEANTEAGEGSSTSRDEGPAATSQFLKAFEWKLKLFMRGGAANNDHQYSFDVTHEDVLTFYQDGERIAFLNNTQGSFCPLYYLPSIGQV